MEMYLFVGVFLLVFLLARNVMPWYECILAALAWPACIALLLAEQIPEHWDDATRARIAEKKIGGPTK